MKKGLKIGAASLAALLVFGAAGCSVKDKDGKAWAEKNGYVKAEDYNIVTDDDSTTGSSVTTPTEAKALTQAKIKELALDYLRGSVLYYTDAENNEYAPVVDKTTVPFSRVKDDEGDLLAHRITSWVNDGYKVKKAFTYNNVQYAAYSVITEEVYNSLDEASKANCSLQKKAVYGESVKAKTLTPHYSYREMYPIATSHNNKTGLATAEFWIDTTTMKLYSFSENGTEKTLYINDNPYVEMYFTKQVEEDNYVADMTLGTDYWRSYGVQIKGNAKILDSKGADATLFNSIVTKYAQTMYGYEGWAQKVADGSAAAIPAIYSNMTCIEITPDEYVVNSLWARYITEANKNQWTGNEMFKKWATQLVGKDVRQTYKVND